MTTKMIPVDDVIKWIEENSFQTHVTMYNRSYLECVLFKSELIDFINNVKPT